MTIVIENDRHFVQGVKIRLKYGYHFKLGCRPLSIPLAIFQRITVQRSDQMENLNSPKNFGVKVPPL